MFHPQAGDLLFQRQNRSDQDATIQATFVGYGGYGFTHVALCVDEQWVVEAIAPRVRLIRLDAFLAAAHAENPAQVLVFRLQEEYQPCVQAAIAHARTRVGLPYNSTFGDRQDAYYCSQLIVECFRVARPQDPVFSQTAMSFRDPQTGQLFDYWVNYYAQLQQQIPEGQPGSHPTLLSLSDRIQLVHQYDKLIET